MNDNLTTRLRRWTHDADAMLRERGNHSEKPNSSTNHDAAPAARATTKPGGLNSGSASGTSGEQSPVTKPSSGTGDTQEPVAWAAGDISHRMIEVHATRKDAENAKFEAAMGIACQEWEVFPLYRTPQTCPHVRGTVTQFCALNFTLTDEEREAVKWCRDNIIPMSSSASAFAFIHTATLRKLLERLK